MTLRRAALPAAVLLATAILVNTLNLPGYAQTASDLSALVGRWQINPGETRLNRNGPNGKKITRAATYTFIFTPQGDGLRLDTYTEYPQRTPARTINVLPDGMEHPCTGPCYLAGGAQSYTYYKIDSHMLARIARVNGVITEYETYAVSADGKTFTMIDWSPETPQWQNIYIFEKKP